MHLDMTGEPIEVGNWVAINGAQRMKILRVCKLNEKMMVVEYFTAKRKDRKTLYVYAADAIKLTSEAVFRLALMT